MREDDPVNDEFPSMWAGAHPWRATIKEASAAPIPQGGRSALLMRHGSLAVRYYAPKGTDPQQPHDQDEVYVIASGSGMFVNGDDRVPFGPGDVLFTPAGQVHRFEDFSDDFATWVVFYGPRGGEKPA
ncbi:MAG: cupin domain-containing protein [Acidiferrobacterales bacterium]